MIEFELNPRGALSERLLETLARPPHAFDVPPVAPADPRTDDDLHLALYLCYELHYRGLPGVDEGWEWEPSLVAFRRALEEPFEQVLRAACPVAAEPDVPGALQRLATGSGGPSPAVYMEERGTLGQFREFLVHRSAYHLKEADPHSFTIPRLSGRAKAAMLEIQIDEYGTGSVERMHSELFARTMSALELDATYGAYIDRLPGITLATVNLMSLFGLNRRLRAANVGHLALFEMTSTTPNRRYGNALRRLGFGEEATRFFDEHVEADAAHEAIALHDMAGSLAEDEPRLAGDIVFGARSLAHLDELWAAHVLARWQVGSSSLLSGAPELSALP